MTVFQKDPDLWQDAEDSEEKNIKRIRNIIKKIYVIAFQEFVLHKILQFLKQGGRCKNKSKLSTEAKQFTNKETDKQANIE